MCVNLICSFIYVDTYLVIPDTAAMKKYKKIELRINSDINIIYNKVLVI